MIRSDCPVFVNAACSVKKLSVSPEEYYANGYDDMKNRVPLIEKAERILYWQPKVSLQDASATA